MHSLASLFCLVNNTAYLFNHHQTSKATTIISIIPTTVGQVIIATKFSLQPEFSQTVDLCLSSSRMFSPFLSPCRQPRRGSRGPPGWRRARMTLFSRTSNPFLLSIQLFRLSCSTMTHNGLLWVLTHVMMMYRPIAVSPIRLHLTAVQPTTLSTDFLVSCSTKPGYYSSHSFTRPFSSTCQLQVTEVDLSSVSSLILNVFKKVLREPSPHSVFLER
ncbi:unnamed protein product [Acanthosepion pharaonis]|uniref:Uncharacterized protein n=1 Tax=Acanthosepion pharaonis TaxID=158019 RepID=A0A812DB35_ACAPH|nr:unnamed protein product [Sepia pharaonis]